MTRRLTQFFVKYRDRGVGLSETITRKSTIQAFNVITLLAVVVYSFYVIEFFIMGSYLKCSTDLFCLAGTYSARRFLNIQKDFTKMRLIIFFLAASSITSSVAYFGLGFGFEYNFLMLIGVSTVVFEVHERPLVKTVIICSLLNFILINFLMPDAGHLIKALDSEANAQVFRAINYLIVASVIAYSIVLAQDKHLAALNEIENNRLKLSEASRLAALGEMAGGIAHEINNPMAVISMAVEQAIVRKQRGQLDSENLDKIFDKISRMSIRVSSIIRAMKKISHQGDSEPIEKQNVFDLFEDIRVMSEEKLKKNQIEFKVDVKDRSLSVMCSPNQALQALLNLMNNSIDAVSELEFKEINLRAYEADDIVIISLKDSGAGIDNSVAEKIFNPFFTTKPVGKETGLGLSVSRSILKDMGGSLDLNPRSANTEFVMTLRKA